MFHRLKRNLLFSIGLGAVIFLGMSVYSDLDRLMAAFGRFDRRYIPAALALALGNYLVRFVRWEGYLKLLRIPLGRRDSFVIFLAGLVMSVTPGKAGELLKAYFVRYRLGTPVSHSAPAVLAERLTDFISLILLAFLGIFSFQKGLVTLLAAAAVTAGIVLLLGWPGAAAACIQAMDRSLALHRLAGPLARAYEGVRLLIAPMPLLWSVALGVGAWFAECLGFFLVLAGFGAEPGVLQAAFVYSFSTLVGAVSMLPGGLGPTEGSLSGLLVLRGMPLPDAVAATFVIRVCTLWFAVALGAGTLLCCRRQLGGAAENFGQPPDRQAGPGAGEGGREAKGQGGAAQGTRR